MRDAILKQGSTGMPGNRAILIFVMGLAFCSSAGAGESVTLGWNPSPSANIAGYMIYYGSNGTNYGQQANAGNNTSWTVTGLQEGTTNYFEVSAYDIHGNQSAPSSPIAYVVPASTAPATNTVQAGNGVANELRKASTNTAGSKASPADSGGGPVLAAVPDQSVAVGSVLLVSNAVSDATAPASQITFWLGAGAPAGSAISADGVFTWAPVCEQGSTTNLITIWAIDNGTPALSNSVSFNVIVGTCVQVSVGSGTVLVGNEASVSVNVYSTVSLTNVSFSLATLAGRFADWGVAAGSPETVSATVQASDPSQPQFNFAVPGGLATGASSLGTISVQCLATGDSTFAPLTVNSIAATDADSTPVGSVFGLSGRMALIAAQPILEATFTNAASPVLTLYGNPGSNYRVMSATNLAAPIIWTTFTNFTLTSPVQSISPGPVTNQLLVFRAAQL
jgi:hypothetical protein